MKKQRNEIEQILLQGSKDDAIKEIQESNEFFLIYYPSGATEVKILGSVRIPEAMGMCSIADHLLHDMAFYEDEG